MIRLIAGLFLVTTVFSGFSGEGFCSELQIMREDQYPKAIFFRASERIGKSDTVAYDKWDKNFSQLMGVIGKVLNNELPHIKQRGSDSFKRFKLEHPEQIVLCHYNGNARDPRHKRHLYFDGHWMYYNGAKITKDISAQTGEMEIHVDNPSLFKTNIGLSKSAKDDIGLCRLDAEGKPDWHQAEQVKLISVNLRKKTIRVERAQYGTKPLSFSAGKAYAAAHMYTGPWGKKGNLLWRYNYSITGPRDKDGQRCIDVRVAEIKKQFSLGGRLHGFDGVEFDALLHHPEKRMRGRGADCDADGVADSCMIGGRQVYGIGTVEYMRKLREALGEDKLIMGDGNSARHNRAFFINNGIESEGWPNQSDHEIRDWSGGLNRLGFWQQNARTPQFNYINHKFKKVPKGQTLPFSRHRIVFAAAMFTDAGLTFSFRPPKDSTGQIPVWDEFRKGEEKELGWLGRPVSETVHLADQSPDLLKGSFTSYASQTEGCTIQEGRLLCTGQQNKVSFVLKKIPISGENITIRMQATGESMTNYPVEIARLMEVELLNSGEELVSKILPQRGIGIHGSGYERGDIPGETGAKMKYKLYKAQNGSHPAYFMRPPGKGGKGYTWFRRDVTVPQGGKLDFYTAMGVKSPGKSDGVWFRIMIAEISGDKAGAFKQVFEHTQKSNQWVEHSISLEKYSGKTVALKFISDCGPNENSAADQSYWGSVKMNNSEDYGIGAENPEQTLYMSYVNKKPFISRFFFKKLNRKFADIRITVEGPEPVVFDKITVHAAPDVAYREFTNGLVLANPGLTPFTFDLDKIVPDKKYRRLKATRAQDIVANNGKAVGNNVTLSSKDGLFLVRDK